MSPFLKVCATIGLAVGLGTALSPEAAHATPTTYTLTEGVIITASGGNNGDLTGWAFTASIPQFSSSLPGYDTSCGAVTGSCTLTDVSVTITNTATGNVVFTGPNNASGSLQFFSIGSQITFTNPFTNVFTNYPASFAVCSSNVGLSAGSCSAGSVSFAANQSITATLLGTATNSTTFSTTDGSILAAIASGAYEVIDDGITLSYTNGTNNNNVATAPHITAYVAGTVTYTYVDAPEPATLMVLGVALVGLGGARRRKRKVSHTAL
jgi:hypothetical protein